MKKKVLVSGCFDLLHAGHIAFFTEAASYGELYVCVGSDSNIRSLKQKATYFSEEERLYLVQNIRCVKEALISSGTGMLDFEPDMRRLRPDIFVVNRDGHTPEKASLCRELNVEYKVLKRIPAHNLPARASSIIKKEKGLPYRICLAGGWMDQPWISEYHPGSVVVFQINSTIDFNDRSGMATSSRKVAMELWGNRLPAGDPVRNAQLLFGAENPPGTQYVSGSQDQLGILLPGINRLYYNGGYWPSTIESITDQETVAWLESVFHLIPMKPRPDAYDPIREKNLTQEGVKLLGEAGNMCWESIIKRDVSGLGASLFQTLAAWQQLLPCTVLPETLALIEQYHHYPGVLFSGSGGGYLMVISEQPIGGALKVSIRTE